MPGSRSVRARKPTRDDALGKAWAASAQNGVRPEVVASEILATPADQAAAGVRALGLHGGASALPLLQHLAEQAPPGIALAAVESLGDVRSAEAADALEALARSTSNRALQKAARRSL
jgi:hypothetical protein